MRKLSYRIFKHLPISLRWLIVFLIQRKFLVGITALIENEGKILFLKNSYQYYWSLPGGYLKAGESFSSSIEREVKEETGLEVKMEKIIQIKNVAHKPVIDILVTCTLQGGNLKVDQKEVLDAGFFDVDNLPTRDNMPKFQLDYIDLFQTLNKR